MSRISDDRFDRLLVLAHHRYDTGDAAHDFAHISRVIASCRRLGEAENADLTILLPAALLHDVVNLPKDHPERHRGSELAAEEAAVLLREVGYEEAAIARIQRVIVEHSFSAGHRASSVESEVMQDADRLDALGSIGLMRMIAVGGKLGRAFYDEEDPLAERREFDDRRFTIDHMGTKLFKLAGAMNTKAGRVEAERRTESMRVFLAQLMTEIRG